MQKHYLDNMSKVVLRAKDGLRVMVKSKVRAEFHI